MIRHSAPHIFSLLSTTLSVVCIRYASIPFVLVFLVILAAVLSFISFSPTKM